MISQYLKINVIKFYSFISSESFALNNFITVPLNQLLIKRRIIIDTTFLIVSYMLSDRNDFELYNNE